MSVESRGVYTDALGACPYVYMCSRCLCQMRRSCMSFQNLDVVKHMSAGNVVSVASLK